MNNNYLKFLIILKHHIISYNPSKNTRQTRRMIKSIRNEIVYLLSLIQTAQRQNLIWKYVLPYLKINDALNLKILSKYHWETIKQSNFIFAKELISYFIQFKD